MKKLPLIFALLLCATGLEAQPWSGILAPSRAIDWTNAGIPGGIPSSSYTQCGSTISSGASTATIQSALNACTANHFVLLGAGTFTLSASIHNATNGVVLRGSGPTNTTVIVNGHNILMGNGSGGQGSTPGGLGATNLSTLTQGSTVLSVASTSGMSVGQVVQIDQLNDTSYVNIVGNEGTENAGRCGTTGFSGCSTRAQLELVQITAIGAGTITIAAPGLSHTYTSGLTPQVFFWSSTGSSSLDGVENLKVDAGDGSAGHAASDFAISFPFCNECWVKNVAVINGHRAAVYFLWSYRDEVRDSYISESNTAGAPTEYGIECDTCSLYKIENNILFGVTSPILIETSYGGVVGYNYMLNTSVGNQFPNLDTHRVHNFLELNEGNTVGTMAWDFIWGGGSQNTMFRNRSSGNDPNKNNYQLPVADAAWNNYANIVGNVLGDPTFHLNYQCTNTTPIATNTFIYEIGFNNRCEVGTSGYDTNTLATMMRWGNWDAATWCANGGHGGTACGATGSNGIRFCTASATGNPACTTDERGNTTGIFPVVSGSPPTTLPPTFYTGSNTVKPSCGTGLSFWKNPSTGFCPSYPVIGPDVTTGTIANTNGHAGKNPAQLCYENSAKSGGFLTAFDAAPCYSADTGGSPTVTSITVLPNPAAVTTTTTVNMQTATTCGMSSGPPVAAGTSPCLPVWTDTAVHSTINSSAGVVTGVSAGSDTVTATIGAITGTATVNVTAPPISIVQQPNSTGPINFRDCTSTCTNPTLTLNATTTAGNLAVVVVTSTAPITNIQGGGVYFLLYYDGNSAPGTAGLLTNSNALAYTYMGYVLNAPAMSSVTVNGSITGAIGFYEINGVNAVDIAGSPKCTVINNLTLSTNTTLSTTCTTTHADEVLIGSLGFAPNTATITGALTQDAVLASNRTVFASAVMTTTGSKSFTGTWTSGSGRPVMAMGGFYLNTSLPTALPPIASPSTGRYGPAQDVSLTCLNTGCVVHYSTSGTATCASTTYSTPIHISANTTLSSIACNVAGYNNSPVNTRSYIISGNTTPQTWYINGTTGAGRWSAARVSPGGSGGPFTGSAIGCDGKSPSTYVSGTNNPCPFNDYRFLWDDQTFNNSNANTWVIQGGDTVIVTSSASNAFQPSPQAPWSPVGWDNNTGTGAGSTWDWGGGVNGGTNPPMPSGVPVASATACSVSAGVATITAANTLTAGAVVMPDYFTTANCRPLNGQVYTVLGSGLLSSQFQVLATLPNFGTTSDTGTVFRPTRILGANFGACSSNASKTVIYGTYPGVGAALELSGAQHVDIECIDLTRKSACIQHGSPALPSVCVGGLGGDSFDSDGIHTDLATRGIYLQDMWIHGHPNRGIIGPIGGVETCVNCDISTNGMAGRDFDDGKSSSNGVPNAFGSLNQLGTPSFHGVWNFLFSTLEWSGCNQQYPFVDPIPVATCYGQSNGGYGDQAGSPPGTSIETHFDHVICIYGVQDCLDTGHNDAGPSGSGYNDQTASPETITNSYAFGNSGSAWKSGPNTSPVTITNTVANINCQRLSAAITGVPSAFNANLGDFCRAANAMSLNYHSNGTITIGNNTVISYAETTYLLDCWEGDFNCANTTLNFKNNLHNGLQNALAPSHLTYNGNSGGVGGFFFGQSGNSAATLTSYNRLNNLWYGVRTENCSIFTSDVCNPPLFTSSWAPCVVSGGSGCTFTEATWDVLRLTSMGGLATPGFNLSSSSPAINAGTTPCPATDFAGTTQTSPCTIGALVASGAPSTVATPTASPVAGTYATTQTVALSTATGGATICYTTDSSTPLAATPGTCSHGTTYTTSITVATTTTIKAIGTLSGDLNSAVLTAVYTIVPIVATPTDSPGAGTYTSAQSVTLATVTSGAAICYTTNGATPGAATAGTCDGAPTQTYSGAISVGSTTTIKAIGTHTGDANSSVLTSLYTINIPTAATPTCTPASGTYTSPQTVTCSSTTAASTTRCTTNGTTPNGSSPVCTSISVPSSLTIKAFAQASGFIDSAVLTAPYTINIPVVATPTASPVAGTYTSIQSVTLSTVTAGATICYTITGATPTATTAGTCDGAPTQTYSGAITVSSTTTIKAIGTLVGDINSGVLTALYTINLPTAATPTCTPVPGTYAATQTVTCSSTTPSSTTRCTINGTTPNGSSPVCTSISISSTATLKALSQASGFLDSTIPSYLYTITPPTVVTDTIKGVKFICPGCKIQ